MDRLEFNNKLMLLLEFEMKQYEKQMEKEIEKLTIEEVERCLKQS